MSSTAETRKIFLKSFYTLAALLTLPLLPLFAHSSLNHQILQYSYKYFALVAGSCLALLMLALVLARYAARHRRPALITNLCISLVSVYTCLLLTEVALRQTIYNDVFEQYHSWGNTRKNIFGFAAKVNHKWTLAGATAHTDQLGFRVHLQNHDWINSAKPRYFTLGGSSTFGFGLNDDQTWPHFLQNELGSSIELINAANNGYNSLQTYLRVYLQLLQLNPHTLIFYQNINDIRLYPKEPGEIMMSEEILFSSSLVDYLNKGSAGQKNYYQRTILGNMLSYQLGVYLLDSEKQVRQKLGQDLKPVSPDPNDPLVQQILQVNGGIYRRNIVSLMDLCKRHGIRLVFATFLHDAEHFQPAEGFYLDHYNQILRETTTAEGFPLVDLAERFKDLPNKTAYFQRDAYHPSAQGAQWIAGQLGQYFKQNQQAH